MMFAAFTSVTPVDRALIGATAGEIAFMIGLVVVAGLGMRQGWW